MACIRLHIFFLGTPRRRIHLIQHGKGNEGILPAVDEQHRRAGVRHLCRSAGLPQRKARPAAQQRVCRVQHGKRRQAIGFFQLITELLPCSGIAAILHDSPHVGRQRLSRRHHYGGGPHGHAHEHDIRRAVLCGNTLHPCGNVPPLGPAHPDIPALALAVAACVRQQQAEARVIKPARVFRHARCLPGIAVAQHRPGRIPARAHTQSVQLQAVARGQPPILMGLRVQPFPVRRQRAPGRAGGTVMRRVERRCFVDLLCKREAVKILSGHSSRSRGRGAQRQCRFPAFHSAVSPFAARRTSISRTIAS